MILLPNKDESSGTEHTDFPAVVFANLADDRRDFKSA